MTRRRHGRGRRRDDRQRAIDALNWWQNRFTEAAQDPTSMGDMLALAVDWIRAERALAGRWWPGNDSWADDFTYKAASVVFYQAQQLDIEIRKELDGDPQ